MKINNYVLIVFLLSLINCSKSYDKYFKSYEKISGFPQEEKWEFNRLSDISFFRPPKMKYINDQYLVILSSIDGNMIHIINIDNGKLLKSFGKMGQGPGEFIGACSILFTRSAPDKFWIFDVTLRRLTEYNINRIFNFDKIEPDTIINISSDAGAPFKMCCLNSDTFIANGALKSSLCFYNSRGDTIQTNGYIPGIKDENTPNFVHFQAYQRAMNTNFDRKGIIIGYRDGDILEIYDFKGSIIKTVHGPDYFLPKYKYSGTNAGITSNQSGYFDLCSSSNYIYCVYSGERQKNVQDWIASLGKNILIFNWKGEPIKRAKTDIRLGDIDISEKRNTIYAICYDGEEFFIGYHELSEKVEL